MTSMNAIKEYFGKPNAYGTERKVENRELMELKKGCTPEEWNKLGQECAKALGQTWEGSSGSVLS